MGRKGAGLGVKLKEREELWPAKAVEGTDQCVKCQCYMSLGDGRLCMIKPGDFRGVADIVGWAPGKCASYLEESGPFAVAQDK